MTLTMLERALLGAFFVFTTSLFNVTVLAACGPTWTPPMEQKRATPNAFVPQAARFCVSSADMLCVDFSDVPDGALPPGWIGGEGLLVKPSESLKGQKALSPFEPREQYLVQVPVALEGDYRVEVLVLPCPGCQYYDANTFTFSVGNLQLTLGRSEFGQDCLRLTLGNAATDVGDAPGGKCGFDTPYHLLALEKTGNIFKLFYDGAEKLVARYDVPRAAGVTFASTSRGFAIAGFRVRKPFAAAPPTTTAELTCPTECTKGQVCRKGACTPLCPWTEGYEELVFDRGNGGKMIRSFSYTDETCPGGPCVWDFKGGFPLEEVEIEMRKLGCTHRAMGAGCCASPVVQGR